MGTVGAGETCRQASLVPRWAPRPGEPDAAGVVDDRDDAAESEVLGDASAARGPAHSSLLERPDQRRGNRAAAGNPTGHGAVKGRSVWQIP